MTISKFLLRENNNLDFIRFVCASFVIVGHSYLLNPANGHVDFVTQLTGFTYSGALAVKIFFFLSGMLVTDSLVRKRSIKSYVISRMFRMMPGLIFVLLITAFIIGPLLSSLPARAYFSNFKTYKYVISNLVFVSNYELPGLFTYNYHAGAVNGSLWSLRIEVRCYLFLLLAFLIIHRLGFGKKGFNFIIALVFADAISGLHLIGRGDNTENNLLPMCFALGALLAVNKEKIRLDYRIEAALILVTALFWRTRFNEIVFTVAICYSVLMLCKSAIIRKIKLKHDISYGIYLWGFLVQQTIFRVIWSQNIYVFILYSLAISFIMGYVSFVFVERRFMELGKQLDQRWNIWLHARQQKQMQTLIEK